MVIPAVAAVILVFGMTLSDGATSTFATAGEAAQSHPNFGGVWIPIGGSAPSPPPPPADGAPLPPPPPKTLSLTIDQTPALLTVSRKVAAGDREVVHSFTCKLDGSEIVREKGPLVVRSRAAWQSDALIVTSATFAGGTLVNELREIYRLDTGQLVIETTGTTGTGTFTTKTVFRRE